MSRVHGWKDEMEVARDIYGGQFGNLLYGPLVFAYRNLGKTGTIKLLVISKRPDNSDFMYGYLPLGSGWTEYNPRCTLEFLKEIIYKDLVSNKTHKEIIEDFTEILKNYE